MGEEVTGDFVGLVVCGDVVGDLMGERVRGVGDDVPSRLDTSNGPSLESAEPPTEVRLVCNSLP